MPFSFTEGSLRETFASAFPQRFSPRETFLPPLVSSAARNCRHSESAGAEQVPGHVRHSRCDEV
jgi:hypothetical protein